MPPPPAGGIHLMGSEAPASGGISLDPVSTTAHIRDWLGECGRHHRGM